MPGETSGRDLVSDHGDRSWKECASNTIDPSILTPTHRINTDNLVCGDEFILCVGMINSGETWGPVVRPTEVLTTV